jgi:hypothetical protein
LLNMFPEEAFFTSIPRAEMSLAFPVSNHFG